MNNPLDLDIYLGRGRKEGWGWRAPPGLGGAELAHWSLDGVWVGGVSISPSIEYSGLISFSMDWLDLLAVQGALQSLLQLEKGMANPFSFPT